MHSRTAAVARIVERSMSRRRDVLVAAAALSGILWLWRRQRQRRWGGLDSAVSASARSVCAARAVESGRDDCLFRDPFSAHFAGRAAVARLLSAQRGGSRGNLDNRIAVRTRFFDDALAAALRLAPGAQVVLLGAGLDARAWRLSPPEGTPLSSLLLEVDRADVLAAKAAGLASFPGGPPPLTLCKTYASCSVDLTEPGWPAKLAACGHDAAQPTVWILEGLLYYLPQHAVETLLSAAAAASAPGSSLIASCVNTPAMLRAQSNTRSEAMRSFCSAIDEPREYFRAHGWEVLAASRPGDPDCSYGRYPPVAADESATAARTFYVSSTRIA